MLFVISDFFICTHNYSPIFTHSLFFTFIYLACVALVLHCTVLCTLTVMRTGGVHSDVANKPILIQICLHTGELVLFKTCRDIIQPFLLSLQVAPSFCGL